MAAVAVTVLFCRDVAEARCKLSIFTGVNFKHRCSWPTFTDRDLTAMNYGQYSTVVWVRRAIPCITVSETR